MHNLCRGRCFWRFLVVTEEHKCKRINDKKNVEKMLNWDVGSFRISRVLGGCSPPSHSPPPSTRTQLGSWREGRWRRGSGQHPGRWKGWVDKKQTSNLEYSHPWFLLGRKSLFVGKRCYELAGVNTFYPRFWFLRRFIPLGVFQIVLEEWYIWSLEKTQHLKSRSVTQEVFIQNFKTFLTITFLDAFGTELYVCWPLVGQAENEHAVWKPDS